MAGGKWHSLGDFLASVEAREAERRRVSPPVPREVSDYLTRGRGYATVGAAGRRPRAESGEVYSKEITVPDGSRAGGTMTVTARYDWGAGEHFFRVRACFRTGGGLPYTVVLRGGGAHLTAAGLASALDSYEREFARLLPAAEESG